MTIKQHIDAAIEKTDRYRKDAAYGPIERGDGREFALAITALEEAKMRVTRGLAKGVGIFNEVDLETTAGRERATANHAANVAGNRDGGISRS